MSVIKKNKKWPTKKTKRKNSVQFIEKELLAAIRKKNKEKVSSCVDKLHRMGVHEGLSMDLGKKFLRESR